MALKTTNIDVEIARLEIALAAQEVLIDKAGTILVTRRVKKAKMVEKHGRLLAARNQIDKSNVLNV